jgi:hypothetical protein
MKHFSWVHDWQSAKRGALYDGSSFKTLDHPEANGGTFALGIDGYNVVGYFIGAGYHGFLYDGNSYQTLDVIFRR